MRSKPTRQGVTLHDVAVDAHVSMMTVSNVINGKFGSMTEGTRRRIEAAIVKLNYRPHAIARNLRVARLFSIGMIIVDRSPTYLADPFITQVVAGLSNYLSSRNYALVIQGQTPANLTESNLLRGVLTDGFCLMLSGEQKRRREIIDQLGALGHPIVLFQEASRPTLDDVCVLRQDDWSGGRQLAEHALERRRGGARFVFLTTRWRWSALQERERGIRAAIAACDRRIALHRIECVSESAEDTVAGLSNYLVTNAVPQVIFAGNDQMGIAVLKYLRKLGVRVPQDVLVTGFNAFIFREFSDPVLTSIRSPAYDLGALGGEVLVRRLETGAFPRNEIVLPVKLLLGETT